MAEKWNFTYEFIDAKQNWGTYMNETWTGTVRLLMDGHVDVGMCAMSSTHSRSMVVDFSSYILMSPIAFILQHPKSLTNNKNILIQPFTWQLWLAICISFKIVWILIKFIHVKRIYHRLDDDVSMKLCAIFLRQPINFSRSKSTKIRILYLSLMITMIVLTTYYCGSYFSILNLSQYESSIDTVNDLLKAVGKQNSFHVQTIKFSSIMNLVMHSRQGPYYWLGENIRRLVS